jgi:hypothetical protein
MISAPFAAILAAGRSQFNQRMVEAKRRHAGLNTDAFSKFLIECVDPVVAAVSLADAARAPAAALAAYDAALELTTTGMRSPMLAEAWCRLGPRLAQLIARQPAEVLGMLSNAVLYIESVPRARGRLWLDTMVAIAGRIDTTVQLKAAGQVLAWRCGVAHFRSGALAAADQVPEALALALFDAGSGDWPTLRDQLRHDPWWQPRGRCTLKLEIGAFTGMGGEFSTPPEVHAHAGTFTVMSGETFHLLIADAWGAVLHPSDADEHAVLDAVKGDWKLKANVLHIGQRELLLDLPPEGIRICCNGPTLAITSPYTHAIGLVSAT